MKLFRVDAMSMNERFEEELGSRYVGIGDGGREVACDLVCFSFRIAIKLAIQRFS